MDNIDWQNKVNTIKNVGGFVISQKTYIHLICEGQSIDMSAVAVNIAICPSQFWKKMIISGTKQMFIHGRLNVKLDEFSWNVVLLTENIVTYAWKIIFWPQSIVSYLNTLWNTAALTQSMRLFPRLEQLCLREMLVAKTQIYSQVQFPLQPAYVHQQPCMLSKCPWARLKIPTCSVMQYKSPWALKDFIISIADIMKLKTKEQHGSRRAVLALEGARVFLVEWGWGQMNLS